MYNFSESQAFHFAQPVTYLFLITCTHSAIIDQDAIHSCTVVCNMISMLSHHEQLLYIYNINMSCTVHSNNVYLPVSE